MKPGVATGKDRYKRKHPIPHDPRPFEFDPEGEGYDHKTAHYLKKKHPLTVPRPKKYEGDVVRGKEDSHEVWRWHGDKEGYKKHGSSRDPETGMLLKGMKHKTADLMLKGEEEAGMEIYKKNGRYYSRKKK